MEHLAAPRDDFVSNILKECLDLPEVRRAAPAAAARAVLVKQKKLDSSSLPADDDI